MPNTATSPLRTFRTLALAFMGALVFIGIAMYFAIGSSTSRNGRPVHHHAPPSWVYVVIVALTLASAATVQLIGYRLPALTPGTDPASQRGVVLAAYQQTMFLRFALIEAVAIIGIALTFSTKSNTILPYVLAAVLAELQLAYHVWPSESLISRVQQKLDRNGGRSDLVNVLNGTY